MEPLEDPPPHRCGHAGGRNLDDEPCGRPVPEEGDRCRYHPRRNEGETSPEEPGNRPTASESGDHPGRGGHPWEVRVEAAKLRLTGSTQQDTAEELGISARTLRRWERGDDWGEAVREARKGPYLTSLGFESLRVVYKEIAEEENATLARQMVERLYGDLAPPTKKMEHSLGGMDLQEAREDAEEFYEDPGSVDVPGGEPAGAGVSGNGAEPPE